MILSREKIIECVESEEFSIEPFTPANLKAGSYMFTLDSRFKRVREDGDIDSRHDPELEESEISEGGTLLNPGKFAIFYTKEKVTLNGNYACILSTSSSCAQMGLDVLQGSIYAEPDTDNQFALEIFNAGEHSIRLFPGTRIVKGVFIKVLK